MVLSDFYGMITLQIKNQRTVLIKGSVIRLKVVTIKSISPGRWRLVADDVTPLPGADPTSYTCEMCGLCGEAQPNGYPPVGWVEREFKQGSWFVCSDQLCQEQPFCRICGCTDEHACETEEGPCYWVEPNLCSACLKEESDV